MKTIEYTFTYQTRTGAVGDQSIIVTARDINSGARKAMKRALDGLGSFEFVRLQFSRVI